MHCMYWDNKYTFLFSLRREKTITIFFSTLETMINKLYFLWEDKIYSCFFI